MNVQARYGHARHAHIMHGHVMHGHVMHTHVMHDHIMHDHIMHANALHCMLYVRINSDMPTVAKRPKTAACQLKCFKISPTAKVGMSLKINCIMPPTAKG